MTVSICAVKDDEGVPYLRGLPSLDQTVQGPEWGRGDSGPTTQLRIRPDAPTAPSPSGPRAGVRTLSTGSSFPCLLSTPVSRFPFFLPFLAALLLQARPTPPGGRPSPGARKIPRSGESRCPHDSRGQAGGPATLEEAPTGKTELCSSPDRASSPFPPSNGDHLRFRSRTGTRAEL